MLLKSLQLHNFRQYKGDQSVVFSTDPEKNVTVILGDNTFGKTTLLQAFNWCFYEKVLLDNPDDLLNYDVANSLVNGQTEDVEVTIEFTHGGRDYTLTRSRQYSRVGDDVVAAHPKVAMSYKTPDGQTNPIKPFQIERVIHSLLPEGLSNYFFFDTERVAAVSTRKDLKESVKGLLGLTTLENGIDHLGSKSKKTTVLGKLYSALDVDGDKRSKDALTHIQDAQDRINVIAERLAQCDSQIGQLETQKEQYDQLLLDHKESKDLEVQKQKLEASVRRDEESKEHTVEALQQDFSKSSLEYFLVPLVDQAEDFLKAAKLDDKGIKDLTRPTLEEILERGVCVCGLKFSEHPEAIDHIKEEMRYCPPESIGTAVRNYRNELSHFRGDQDDILQGMRDRRANIFLTTERIQENDEQIDLLSEQLKEIPDLSKYEAARDDVKTQLRAAHKKHDSLVGEDATKRNDIERYRKIYDATASTSDKNKKTLLYIQYAEAIAEWLKSAYADKETEIRDALQNRVNEIFNKMYHGTRKVVIDANYSVKLLTELGDTSKFTGESEGLNRVKNFAFIAGLVSLAKEKVVAQSGDAGFDLSSEPYPLVMDAPFSNTDDKHITNISKVLPEASEQVIMFVMAKDWRYAKPVLESRLGSSYVLDKQSEEYSVLKKEG
mgnify:CR=1 FL=1